jgi:UDP-2-acetamido-2-deoxy-ribo-hexuluronate aminotransferase
LNSRLDTIQAAILQVKFKAFKDYELDKVNEAAAMYDKALAGAEDLFDTPFIPEGFVSSWAQYTIRLKDASKRDALKDALKAKGIPSMVYYPKPMHKQLAFGLPEGPDYGCPVTEKLCSNVLSLPMHPYLTQEDVDKVAGEIFAFFGR